MMAVSTDVYWVMHFVSNGAFSCRTMLTNLFVSNECCYQFCRQSLHTHTHAHSAHTLFYVVVL